MSFEKRLELTQWQGWVNENLHELISNYDIDFSFESEENNKYVAFRRVGDVHFKPPLRIDKIEANGYDNKDVLFMKKWLKKVKENIDEQQKICGSYEE